jgi:hypothetical protein
MKKQRRIPGSILEIQLEDQSLAYAQVLKTGVAFFDLNAKDSLTDLHVILEKPVLFIIEIYDHIITKGRWKIVGTLPIRPDLIKPPLQFIQDQLAPDKFELYDPISGDIYPATRDECIGLECAAVWEAEHVEGRLIDHYNNRENIWVKMLSMK